MLPQKITFESSCDYSLFEKEIRKRLKNTRIELGFISAKDFAVNKGIKISTYALHEAGTRSMSIKVIVEYANLLNIQPSWLITGLGAKFNS